MRIAFALVFALVAQPAFAIANPASENCVKLKGKLEIVSQADGSQIGLCRLPNGFIIEEWTLMKMKSKGIDMKKLLRK